MKTKEEPGKRNRPWKPGGGARPARSAKWCVPMFESTSTFFHHQKKRMQIGYGMGMYTCKTGKPTNDWNRCPCHPNNTNKELGFPWYPNEKKELRFVKERNTKYSHLCWVKTSTQYTRNFVVSALGPTLTWKARQGHSLKSTFSIYLGGGGRGV